MSAEETTKTAAAAATTTTVEDDGSSSSQMPAAFDIILGRHKIASDHPGNLRLTEITNTYLEEYKQSTTDKARKSQLLLDILEQVEERKGRFIKLDAKEKTWREVTRSVARERISQGLRDGLKDYYKSSLSHKRKRRLVRKGSLAPDDVALQILSPPAVSIDTETPNKRRRSTTAEEEKHIPLLDEIHVGVGRVDAASIPAGGDAQIIDFALTMNNPIIDQPFLPKDCIELMEVDFQPMDNDVVVGQRKRSSTHPGNMYLLEVVRMFLDEYKLCGSIKNEKSKVLSKVATVLTNDQHPPARFVRQDPKHKRWYVIEGHKELISQKFRDMAQDGYKSASNYKNLIRRKSTGGTVTVTSQAAPNEDMPSLTLVNQPKHEETMHSVEEILTDTQLLPQEKVEMTQPTESVPIIVDAANAVSVSGEDSKLVGENLSKKEQLEQQIEELKKQLETLDNVDDGKEIVKVTLPPQEPQVTATDDKAERVKRPDCQVTEVTTPESLEAIVSL